MKILNYFSTSLLLFLIAPSSIGQITGGLPPLQENSASQKNNHSQNKKNDQNKSASNKFLSDARGLEYQKRVSTIKSEIGRSITLIESTISDSFFYPLSPMHKDEAGLSEASQTWWISGDFGYMVFQNFASQSINGIVVAIDDGGCNRIISQFRKINFSRALKPYETIAARFNFPQDLEKKSRCIDIYDLNYN